MKIKKQLKWLSLLLIFTLCAGTVACGSLPVTPVSEGTDDNDTSDSPASQTATPSSSTEKTSAEPPSQIPDGTPDRLNYPTPAATLELVRAAEAFDSTGYYYPEESALKSANAFAGRTMAAFLKDRQGSNAAYSPISMYYALGLCTQGAAGETQKELTGLFGESTASLADTSQKLFTALTVLPAPAQSSFGMPSLSGEGSPSVSKLANALFLSPYYHFTDRFLDTASQKYYASNYTLDFMAPDASSYVESWIRENTDGMMDPALDLDPATAMALVNTIVFKAQWNTEFRKENNTKEDFTLSDGNKVTAEYMNRKDTNAGIHFGNGYCSARLGLDIGQIYFILPDEGVSPDTVLAQGDLIEQVLHGDNAYYSVSYQIPKFSYSVSMDAIPTLQSLGIHQAFSPYEADFSGLCDSHDLFVSLVRQDVKVEVKEEGVAAAAFTIIGTKTTSIWTGEQKEFRFALERPFIYLIVRDETVLFCGVVENPTV